VAEGRDPAENWDWTAARARCLREAGRIVYSQRDAEDAVQEAFARAWRNRLACRTPAAPLAWLLQITRHEAFRIRERTRPATSLDVAEGPSVAQQAGTDETLERVDVRRALDSLPAEDRVLLMLRYGEDMTQPRVAEVLDLPEGTVKVRLHRLRNRLRGELMAGA
jgi:RNA polymerase sigma-70 factor (ECF subfamily)